MPLRFGDDALEFVREELQAAADDFAGPLATWLLRVELAPPFSFIPPNSEKAAKEWRRGGIDDGSGDERLANAISRWLQRPDTGRERLVALEEPLARYSDPAVPPETPHYGETIYHVASRGDRLDHVRRSLDQLSGYPGIGVLSRPSADVVTLGELTEQALEAVVSATVAVLVRSWDDEGFLIVPLAGRLYPTEFDTRITPRSECP